MAILKIRISLLLFFFSRFGLGKADDRLLYTQIDNTKFCSSALEFKNSFNFLIEHKELNITEPQAIKTALKIAENCTGAFERFEKVYLILQKSGVELNKTVSIALEFSSYDNERAKNFYVLFQKLFLENYLDLDFSTSFQLSKELSKDYKGDPVKLRDDFVGIVDFCRNQSELAINKKLCLELASNLVKSTELYPKGLLQDFKTFLDYVQSHKRLGFDLKQNLNLAIRVLSKGPAAFLNFKQAFEFAINPDSKLNISELQAYQLALTLSDLSINKNYTDPEQTNHSILNSKKSDEKHP